MNVLMSFTGAGRQARQGTEFSGPSRRIWLALAALALVLALTVSRMALAVLGMVVSRGPEYCQVEDE